jgi:hypothetical protein
MVLAALLLMSYTHPRVLISLTFMLGLIGVGSSAHADDIMPPPYVPPIPLEVWIAFGPIAAGGLLILVLYILKNMRGK